MNFVPGYKLGSIDFLDDGQHGWLSVTVPGGHSLLETSDADVSWSTVNSEGQRYFDQMQFLTPDVGWARSVSCPSPGCGVHDLMRTLNGGATWQEVLALEGYGQVNPFYAFSDKSAVVARSAPAWNESIMRTDDGGSSWSTVAQGERESTKVLTAWDESHGVRIRDLMSLSADAVMWTADNRTWQDAAMPVTSGGSFDFIDDQSGWIAGSKLPRTRDGGLTWQTISDMRFGAVDFISQDEGWATQYGCNTVNALCGEFVFHTRDGGDTWERLNKEVNGVYEVTFIDANRGWGDGGPSSPSEIVHADDGGFTWKGGAHMTGRFFAFVDSNVAWVATPPDIGLSSAQVSTWHEKMYVAVTSDADASWQSNSFDAPGFCGNLAIAANDARNAWLIWQKCDGQQTTLEVQRTTDGGVAWQTLSPLPLENIFGAKFFDSSRGIAAGLQCDGKGQCQEVLLRTADGGATWTLEPTGITTNPPASVLYWSPPIKYEFLDPQHIWPMGQAPELGAVQAIYSYGGGDAAFPNPVTMPLTGWSPESSASRALAISFLAAMLGATVLMFGARLRRRQRA